jgi:hypothetical protein
MAYCPTPGPLPGEQWIPSNATEGGLILCSLCSKCARDKAMREGEDFDECDDNELCEIIAASFRGQAVEWREMPDGEVTCIAFVPHGEAIPDPRCTLTRDMFETPNAEVSRTVERGGAGSA